MDAKIGVVEGRSPHWGFWATVVWGLVVAGAYLFLIVITIGVIIGMTKGAVSSLEVNELKSELQYDGFVISVCTFVTTIACSAMLLGIIKLKKGAIVKEYLGLKKVAVGKAFRWVAATLALIAVSDFIAVSMGRQIVPEFMSAVYSSAGRVWMLWVALGVAAPLFEEIFFRGFLIRGFRASFLGPIGAVLVTSALWAVVHMQYDAYDMSTIFVLGVLMGAARIKTGSVLLAIGMHSIMNLVATIETVVSLQK